jgi:hypothetical protein
VATRPRDILTTPQFEGWYRSFGVELKDTVRSTIARIAKGGPTLGRPPVDVIHESRLGKLKEARVDRDQLFAFDSNRNLVMLVGGNKTGKWNRCIRQ